jgi:hypothetical protein
MKFEALPNELLLKVFELLDTIRLFRAFYELNSRFDNLIFNHIRKYHLDFRSLYKHDFDTFCRQYLPKMTDGVVSIHLSGDDEAPHLPTLFLSRGFNLGRFTHLKSLSLYSIRYFEQIHDIISQCSTLQHLTHLKIIKCPIIQVSVIFREYILLFDIEYCGMKVHGIPQLNQH